jgi:hypothetical protein
VLISLLALNGLRVSEATGADIEHLGLERGHRRLTITRKGGKVVTIPLAPRTARAIDLAISERTGGPVFLAADGRRLDGTAPDGSSARSRAAPGSPRPSPRTRSDTRSSPPRSMPGSRCAMSKRPPHMLIREPLCGTTEPGAAWTGTPHTSSPRISRVPPGDPRRLAAVPPGGRSRPADGRGRRMTKSRGCYRPRPQRAREPSFWAACRRRGRLCMRRRWGRSMRCGPDHWSVAGLPGPAGNSGVSGQDSRSVPRGRHRLQCCSTSCTPG